MKDTMTAKLWDFIDAFGDTEVYEDDIPKYDNDGNCIDTAIEKLFEDNYFNSDDYSVDLMEVFDSPAITFYSLSVVWIEKGKLHNEHFTVVSK